MTQPFRTPLTGSRRQGGGTVLVKAGTYTLENTVRLVSHLTLRGEGPDKTILKKAPGVTAS